MCPSTGIRSFVHHEVEGLLARDDRQMVDSICRIATDVALRERIAEHNRTTEPAQSWPHVLADAERLYAAAAHQTARP